MRQECLPHSKVQDIDSHQETHWTRYHNLKYMWDFLRLFHKHCSHSNSIHSVPYSRQLYVHFHTQGDEDQPSTEQATPTYKFRNMIDRNKTFIIERMHAIALQYYISSMHTGKSYIMSPNNSQISDYRDLIHFDLSSVTAVCVIFSRKFTYISAFNNSCVSKYKCNLIVIYHTCTYNSSRWEESWDKYKKLSRALYRIQNSYSHFYIRDYASQVLIFWTIWRKSFSRSFRGYRLWQLVVSVKLHFV